MEDPQVLMFKEEEEEVVVEDCLDMPPGFRFHPTDLEIIIHYLEEKVMNSRFRATAIGEIDLNCCEPWDLPSRAKMGEKEWYFFWQRDRKYPTGTRTNRATESGYWKATGKDREIYKGKGCLVGMKKTLVFYLGRAPKGEKTNWVMHEYRLEGNGVLHHNILRTAKNDWVVCRVFHKNGPVKRSPEMPTTSNDYFGEDILDSSNLPPLLDSPQYPNSSGRRCSSFSDDNNGGSGGATRPFSCKPPGITMSMDIPSYHNVSHLLTPCTVTPSDSAFYFDIPTQFVPQMMNMEMEGYLHYDKAPPGAMNPLSGMCKVEEYTGYQSLGSHDSARSAADRNAEMSSAVSVGAGNNDRSYDDPGSPSVGPLLDLENMWR